MIYMVCYDISNPKRLTKVAKTLENFGIRVQRSFFQCEMSKIQMDNLKNSLLNIVNVKADYLFVYPLCEKCSHKAEVIGSGTVLELETFFIL